MKIDKSRIAEWVLTTAKNNYTAAIILAAGNSTRMGGNINKQLEPLCGIPVLAHTLKAMDKTPLIERLVLVAREEEISFQDSLEGYMSLFSMGDKATVTIENMKYPLCAKEITNSFPIGISNEFIYGSKGKVTVHKGDVVMIVSWV